jgi:flagellin-like protein
MAETGRKSSNRAISPVIGSLMMITLVLLLAAVSAGLFLGYSDELDESATSYDSDACPGFQEVEFSTGGDDFDDFLQELTDNNCAMWLQSENFESEGGTAVRWNDAGPNDFHAKQDDTSNAPQIKQDSTLGIDVLEFQADHSSLDEDDNDPDPGSTDGDYLSIDRDIDELGVDEDSGLVVVALLKVDNFDRGGTWTIGEAGEDGKEFSMRTCGNYDFDGCQSSNTEGEWRGQHWGTADVDFDSGDESAGEWIILTHAYDGSEVTIRVNGQEVATDSVDLDLSANRNIQIGRWVRLDDDPHYYFDGRMAELIIFDRKLADSEIETVEEYLRDEYGISLSGPIGDTD